MALVYPQAEPVFDMLRSNSRSADLAQRVGARP